MPEGIPKKPQELRLETQEEENQRLGVETAPEEVQEPQAEASTEATQELPPEPEWAALLEDPPEPNGARPVESQTADVADLAATRERLGMSATEVSQADSERVRELGGQLESLKATGGKSAERLRNIFNEVYDNPELFGGSSERSNEFTSRVVEKANELKSGPELMRKKEEFWKKWKIGSIITATVGMSAGAIGAAWTSKYGFDHTYLTEILGQSWNLPMVAGFAAAAVAEGSMGIAKLMEKFREKQGDRLKENLRRNNI